MNSGAGAVPFKHAAFVGHEEEYLATITSSGRFGANSAGWATQRCLQVLDEEFGTNSVLTTSCTHALEMAALLFGLQPGDEVILPSFTHPSTANAFVLRGAQPRFCDIRPDTLCLDESQVERLIGSRTKVIVAMHYAGIACEMDALVAISERTGAAIVEDNAHGLFGRYRDKPLGAFGRLSALSFQETKNFSCGEGGALIINDPELYERAQVIRDKGTDQASFLRGCVSDWAWRDMGSSYGLAELLAAVLLGQLEARARIQEPRRVLWDFYMQQLADWAEYSGVTLPTAPAHCEPAYHLFYLVLPDAESRASLAAHLRRRGIGTARHHEALHSSPMGRRYGAAIEDCPIAEAVAERILRLPFHSFLDEAARDMVVAAVLDWDADEKSRR